ncbi:hypothetical protein TEA_006040 [Camellia sinensis var. sinensis]|uniref:DNA mismatch repair proteins mutS family domain-containing protein n=1 Tax=Camellia sinensis var. sinensis TaxID=542762 RepID=A0A4S4DU53_CAMSN|nr:hypothetical protein TEA_006040 [Camellia sinensis var. sinensis]
MKISFFLCSEELLASLRETLKSVKDIPHVLKKFNSLSSVCTTGDWTAFLKSICSLPHVNKIFEVGISGSLREQMKYLNLDIVQKAGSCILTDLAYVYELVSLSIDLNISLGYFVCTLLRFLKVPRSGSSVLQSGVANDFNKMPENVTLQVQLKRAFNMKYCISVIGVFDVSRSKDKGYGTIVKEGFCDEVLRIRAASFLNVCNYSSSPQPPQPTSDKSFHHVELQLDELRQIHEELPEFLEEVSSLELARLPIMSGDKFLPCIVYLHQIGYLMCVFEEKLDETTLENLQDFEFAFSDEDGDMKKFFYCTLKTRELDNLLGDIYHKILDMVRAITGDLVSQILLFSAHLLKALNFSAELDWINIITGPNYSGKSIYIKQVLVCTHLTEMFNDSCIQESDNIKYYTMSVLQPDDGTDIEDIVFLYRLVPGHALLSYGVPEEVIKRAASLLNAIGNNNHVDRLCNDKISAQDRQYKDTIDKMLSFDACNGDLNLFFQDIFPS